MPAKPVYVRCPRCELNYIKKGEKLCSVCKQELESGHDAIDDLDLEYCPVCKTNYIQADEIMCATCAKERSLSIGEHDEDVNSDEWDDYIKSSDEDEPEEDDEEGVSTVSDLDDDMIEEVPIGIEGDLDDSDEEDSDEEDDDEEDDDIDDLDDDFDDDDDEDEDEDDDDDDEDY